MRKNTILIIISFFCFQSILFAQSTEDKKVVQEIIEAFLSAHKDPDDFEYIDNYISVFNSLEVVHERTGKQIKLKTYFASFINDAINIEKINGNYKCEILEYKKNFGYRILFDRILNENKDTKTNFVLFCKYAFMSKNVKIYRIVINNQDILEEVENDENPASLGFSYRKILNDEISCEKKLNIKGDAFEVHQISFAFGHRITGVGALKGIKLNYGLSLTPTKNILSSTTMKFTVNDTTTENSFPYSNINIDEISLFSANISVNFYIMQSLFFDIWKDIRWDLYAMTNFSWYSYQFKGNVIDKGEKKNYNFKIQDFSINPGFGIEYWAGAGLRLSVFGEMYFSAVEKLINKNTGLNIPSFTGINFGFKWYFY